MIVFNVRDKRTKFEMKHTQCIQNSEKTVSLERDWDMQVM